MTVAAMLAGAAVALGLLLVVTGLRPVPEPLTDALARLNGTAATQPEAAPGSTRERLGRRMRALLDRAHLPGSAAPADLRVLDKTADAHAVEKVTAATVGFALPPLLVALVRVGGLGAPWLLALVGAAVLGTGGLALPDVLLRDQAAERRRDFRHALSAYLDLAEILLAAGTGVESALTNAAESGQSWAFTELRGALARAELAGEVPWRALDHLGAELEVPELRELAASLELAGSHGARVGTALRARAAGLRHRDLTETRARAESATERMALPSVLLVLAFIVFVGYPAIFEILQF